jgi:hypothetical protein
MTTTDETAPPPGSVRPASMRVTALCGVLGVSCTTASGPIMPIWGFPPTGSSSVAVSAFVESHRTGLIGGMVLNVAGVSLWLALGAGVWSRLQEAGDRHRGATACFVLGYVAFVTLILTGFLVFVVLVAQLPGPDTARLLYDLTFGLLAISGAPTALALTGFAVHIAQSRLLPAFTVWIAILAAVSHAALVITPFLNEGFFSLEGQVITAVPATLFLWLLVVSIALLYRPPAPRPGPARG